ncbi:MAG TPA: hypothetical protein VM101_03510 [Flavitalea sp.]|nr:hypothetical protein [Flavitalea sp.]
MEVHHHSHTSRKKWTHYFWEFLMLFLAVFAGFLAENKREHIIEHQREKQYIRSLVNDIKSDIGQLEELNKEWTGSSIAADTLLMSLKGNDILTNSGPVLPLVYQSTGFTDFVPNDGTVQQLKNSGGFRLLRKTKVTDSIMAYQKAVDRILIKQAGMNDAQQSRNRVTDLFDVSDIASDNEPQHIALLSTDSKSLNSAFTYILEWKGEFLSLNTLGKNTSDCGERLLKIIYDEYGIR